MSAQLVKKFKRVDPSRAELTMNRASQRATSISFSPTRGAVSLLEKASYEHVKAVIQLEFSVSANDIKEPSAEPIALGGKFYSEVWMNDGREIADEAIRKNE
jgi:hypothetical protein